MANSADPSADYDEIPLRNLPSGLHARVRRQVRTDLHGQTVEIRDRRGRTKLTNIYLYAPSLDQSFTPNERDLTFLLRARRRTWATIIRHYRDSERAWQHACQLARLGAIEIECTTDGFALAEPICWRLTAPWERRQRQATTRRHNQRADWQRRADETAAAVESRFPQLAAALRRERGPVVRPVLVYAAEDLIGGRSYFGPRAFSQAHFGTTKARDDVSRILARAEVEVEAQVELGILRAGRTGLAGPIELRTAAGALNFYGIRGPTDVRLDQPDIQLICTSDMLVVVENRQAAESANDRYPELALFWSAGLMSGDALSALASLSQQAQTVLACTDADLGGVRICEQVLSVAPARVIDIGAWPHQPRPPWKPGSISELGLRAATAGPAGNLAHACLNRGYPVEQELAAVQALAGELSQLDQ